VIAGLLERDGPAVYNTAVLIDRQGRLAGKYRKGEILHSTHESGVYRTIAIDLSERFTDPWLGDMRPRFFKEIRTDVPMNGLGP
jgi:hypothetical protein